MPLLSDLIIEALDHTDNAHNTVKVFLTRVLAITAQKELHFAKIFAKQGDKILAGFKEINAPGVNPSIKVAYMEVALSIVKHDSGTTWLLETGVWKEILKLCNERATVFIARQTYKFMADFLWKLNDLDDITNIRIILGVLLLPISQIDFLNVQSMTSEDEEEICKVIEPSLQILLSVVSQSNRIRNRTLLLTELIKEFKVTSYLHVAIDWIRSEDTVLLLVKLMYWLNLGKAFLAKPMVPGVLYTGEEFLESAATNFNTIQSFIKRRSANLILELCTACNIIWNSIFKDDEPSMWHPEARHQIKNQMLYICLVPLMVFVTQGKSQSEICDIRISDYLSKLLRASCEYTAKAAYAFRDLCSELDTMSIVFQTVKKLIYLRDHYSNEQANLVFQAMFYVLHDYIPKDRHGKLKLDLAFEDTEEKNLVMTYVMDSVWYLVTHRNINWHESVEVVCLYNVVCNILRRQNLSCKVSEHSRIFVY